MTKDEKIRTILSYLNNKMSVMNKSQTDKVNSILDDGDITLKELVDWYIDYVWKNS